MTDLQPDALVAQVQQLVLPRRTSRLEFVVLTASAIAIGVAAHLHGQLFHQGYAVRSPLDSSVQSAYMQTTQLKPVDELPGVS